jgi:membrane fusion protein, heavy metal efflux system
MNTLETENVPMGSAPASMSNAPPLKPRNSVFGKLVLILLLVGVVGGAFYTYKVGTDQARHEVDRAVSYVREHVPETTHSTAPVAKLAEIKPRQPWNGLVKIDAAEATSIGLVIAPVRPQVDPIKLELPGRTDYDPNTQNKIRPRFDTLVEKVHAELGQTVRKGDPLVDLFSTDLAAAKNDFQTAYVQWQHDMRLLTVRKELANTSAIAKQVLVDTLNDENKSRLAYTTAREKLKVFEVPDDKIDALLTNLGDKPLPEEVHTISDKARMTRLSPVDGKVILRDVVPGNLYDTNDVMMVIAPLDHLFVWVNVYEADQVKVTIGQKMEIRFPYLDQMILGTVQYVATEVSKETRAIKIRASIPNPDGKLKADMLVRGTLEIPPVSGQTVIPRMAVVVMDGQEYAFVRKPSGGSDGPRFFERRKLAVAEERYDHIVVSAGLKAGEEVASYGSLILAQLFEDQQMVATGMPLE